MKVTIIGPLYGAPTNPGTVAPLGYHKFEWEGTEENISQAEDDYTKFINQRREGKYSSYPRAYWQAMRLRLEENGETRYAMKMASTIAKVIEICRKEEQAVDINEITALCRPIDINQFHAYIVENWPRWRSYWNWNAGFRTGYPPLSKSLFFHILGDYITETRIEPSGLLLVFNQNTYGLLRVYGPESYWPGHSYECAWSDFMIIPYQPVLQETIALLDNMRNADPTPATQR